MADNEGKHKQDGILVERVQTGIRLEKRLLKVLKGLAEYHDMTLGDLIEGIVLHAFDGKHPFSEETRQRIADLKRIYRLDLDSSASHRLLEKVPARAPVARKQRARKGGAK
jgi:predicted DNA-binding ribbon-helix-helix protein